MKSKILVAAILAGGALGYGAHYLNSCVLAACGTTAWWPILKGAGAGWLIGQLFTSPAADSPAS